MIRRASIAAVCAFTAAVAVTGVHASAHALPQSSTPPAGATLAQPPTSVTITFGEAPDVKLSSISVQNAGGSNVDRGPTTVVTGDPLALQQQLQPLPNGVYTVTWRTVSSVDGHLATGAFAFGVGVSPGAANTAAAAVQSPPPTIAQVIGSLLLLGGFMVALGAAVVAVRLPTVSNSIVLVPLVAACVSLIGLVTAVDAQREAASVPWNAFLSSSLWGPAAFRLLAIATMGAGAVLARRNRRTLRAALMVVALAALGGMWIEATASHAGAQSPVWLNLTAQWLHLAAVGIWIGGLPALLLAIRATQGEERRVVAQRFSFVAGFAFLVVASTGVFRAIIEIRTWDALFSTAFGWLVIGKAVLLLSLGLLGGFNRFRNVPRSNSIARGLQRVASTELVAGFAALVLAATLINIAPPASAQANLSSGLPQFAGAGNNDAATTVHAHLTVSPGRPGFNHFSLTVADFDTGQLVQADSVILQFSLPSHPSLGASTLPLKRQSDGTYAADGANLSIDGVWKVSVFIDRGAQSTEVELQLTTVSVPPAVTASRQAGLPTIYTIALGQRRTLEVYLDPDKPGSVTFHSTFFDSNGKELPVQSVTITETPPGQPSVVLLSQELEPGHFIATCIVPSSATRFDIVGTLPSGDQISTYVTITPGH